MCHPPGFKGLEDVSGVGTPLNRKRHVVVYLYEGRNPEERYSAPLLLGKMCFFLHDDMAPTWSLPKP